MKKLLSIHLLIALAVIFSSCGTGNNVVNNRLISKRKHTKGFFINKKGNQKASKSEKEKESIAFDHSKKERKPYTKSLKANNKKATQNNEAIAENNYSQTENAAIESNEIAERSISSEDNILDDDSFNRESEINDIEGGTNSESESEVGQAKSKAAIKQNKNRAGDVDGMTILLVIVALFIAPLAVGIYEGITTRFWITLILWLIGIGLGFWLFGGALAWLAGLIAAIYAILIVLGVI